MLQSEIEVVDGSVEGEQCYADGVFPAVRLCRSTGITLDDACNWAAENRERLVADASAAGTVLFRGFPLKTAEDFDRFVGAFGLPNFAYEDSLSNAVRINKTPRVFTANEAPPDVTIFFHHEMAQTPIYPSRLFFFCEQPAVQGGATPLCRSDILWERLLEKCPVFARDCEAKGLRYSNVMPAANDHASGMGRSWQSTLKAQTPAEAEERLRGLGYSWTWQDDGCLRATTPVLKAVYDLGDGRKSFFNQLIAAFCGWKDTRNDPANAITLGDGSPLDRDAVMTAVALAEDLAFDVPWRQGDVALVDNYVVMHGRRTFSGTRKVLASLVAA
jgi:hypothetical protein